MQPLGLNLQKFLERDQPFSRTGLILNSPQFLAGVMFNCCQIDLH
jgi:hypothetical protein